MSYCFNRCASQIRNNFVVQKYCTVYSLQNALYFLWLWHQDNGSTSANWQLEMEIVWNWSELVMNIWNGSSSAGTFLPPRIHSCRPSSSSLLWQVHEKWRRCSDLRNPAAAAAAWHLPFVDFEILPVLMLDLMPHWNQALWIILWMG